MDVLLVRQAMNRGWAWCLADLDDFVTGELEIGDVAGVAGHEVAV